MSSTSSSSSTEAAVAAAEATLSSIAAAMALPAFEDHAKAIGFATEQLSRFYLHTGSDGVYRAGAVFLDPNADVAGLYPQLVAPLVRFLRAETDSLDEDLDTGMLMQVNDTAGWARWHDRLRHYEKVVAEEAAKGGFTRSERLWEEVTEPLVQGLYEPHFSEMGIPNPGGPQTPDASTVPSTAWRVLDYNQSTDRIQAWLLRWRERVGVFAYETKAAVREWAVTQLDSVSEGFDALVDRAKQVFFVGLGVAVAIGLLYALYRVSRSEPSTRQLPT